MADLAGGDAVRVVPSAGATAGAAVHPFSPPGGGKAAPGGHRHDDRRRRLPARPPPGHAWCPSPAASRRVGGAVEVALAAAPPPLRATPVGRHGSDGTVRLKPRAWKICVCSGCLQFAPGTLRERIPLRSGGGPHVRFHITDARWRNAEFMSFGNCSQLPSHFQIAFCHNRSRRSSYMGIDPLTHGTADENLSHSIFHRVTTRGEAFHGCLREIGRRDGV